ncbi:MAG: hypothetical protein AB7E24_20200 [Novosphingobium sp.]
MKLRNVFPAVAAAGLVFAPVAAQAGTKAAASIPAAGVSIASEGARASTAVAKKQKATSGLLIGGIALAAVVGGVIISADDNGSGGS